MPDPVMLITGASSGIGAATARHAVQSGYRVVLAARSLDKLSTLADELGGEQHALAVRCDVSEYSDQEALVRSALEGFGQLAVAFANAGFGAPRGFESSLPALRSSRGHALLTGSVAGRRALPGSLYSATKFAVTAMGEALRQEVNDTGIRVTLIEPGMVQTPFFDNPGEGRLEADDIARAVIWAVSQPPHVDVNEVLIRPTAQAG